MGKDGTHDTEITKISGWHGGAWGPKVQNRVRPLVLKLPKL